MARIFEGYKFSTVVHKKISAQVFEFLKNFIAQVTNSLAQRDAVLLASNCEFRISGGMQLCTDF